MLSVKQEAFCLHYAKTGNATESYKAAGYKPKTEGAAYACANRLLKIDKVQARLQELADEMASDKIANIREVQERLTAILRGDLKESFVVTDGEGGYQIIEKPPQLKDVLKAGQELAKMQGGYDTKLNITMTKPVFGGEEDLED